MDFKKNFSFCFFADSIFKSTAGKVANYVVHIWHNSLSHIIFYCKLISLIGRRLISLLGALRYVDWFDVTWRGLIKVYTTNSRYLGDAPMHPGICA